MDVLKPNNPTREENMNKPKNDGWSPYLAGALTGLLAVASAWISTALVGRTRFLGASTTFVRAAGFVQRLFAPESIERSEYLSRVQPVVDWQFMLVIGIFLGALVASLRDKSFQLEGSPPIWRDRFGPSVLCRAIGAFVGGIVAMVGARLADGCPSGHGLTGLMQLSLSGFVSLAFFFGVGVLAAHLIYKGVRS